MDNTDDLLINFGSFYTPDFGMSFKESDDIDLRNITRIEMGNIIHVNKMLAFHPYVDINIYDDIEKVMILNVRKILNKYYLSEEDYIKEVTEMLVNKDSELYKFLLYNENMLTKYYNDKYDKNFENSNEFDKKVVQFEIRQKTYKNPNFILHPVYKKYYNFRTKEKELFKKFLKNKREKYFISDLDFFSYYNKCEEFLLLLDWNCAWVVQSLIKIKIFENLGKTNKEINNLADDLEKLNNKIGRNNYNY